MPIKDHEMRCESESSEEQDQVQNGDDRKCPSHAAFNPENHCNPFQLQLGHLSIHQLLTPRRRTLGGRSRMSLLAHSAGERTVCLL